MTRVLLLSALILVAACGTGLKVSETLITDPEPNGIVVNKVKAYSLKCEAVKGPLEESEVTCPKVLVGIDHGRGLAVNMSRQMFASGNLEVELTKQQTLKKVSIKSTPGTTGAATAAASALKTVDEVRVIEKEQKKDDTPTTIE